MEDKKKVKIIAEGETHHIEVSNDEYILAAALKSGIDMPYSCEAGICTSCMVKCLQGDIEMETNAILSEEELEEGYRLTCVGKPTSSETTIVIE